MIISHFITFFFCLTYFKSESMWERGRRERESRSFSFWVRDFHVTSLSLYPYNIMACTVVFYISNWFPVLLVPTNYKLKVHWSNALALVWHHLPTTGLVPSYNIWGGGEIMSLHTRLFTCTTYTTFLAKAFGGNFLRRSLSKLSTLLRCISPGSPSCSWLTGTSFGDFSFGNSQ